MVETENLQNSQELVIIVINNNFKTIGVFGKYVTIILMGKIVTAKACHINILDFLGLRWGYFWYILYSRCIL